MKQAYIRFMAPVVPQTSDQLFQIFDKLIKEKYEKIHLMISSPGGSVFHGISIHNYIKGAPIEVDTYNFGSVDSIGVVIYCAGKNRLSVPHSRFLIHGVKFNFNGNASFDEKEMEEHYNSLKIDQENIAKIIADTCHKKTTVVEKDMNNRITLNPLEAQHYGLVHKIDPCLFPADAELFVIRELQPAQQIQVPFGFTSPNQNSYTESIDINIGTLLK
jgi:ATP-dependent Clp protease, protease subunit